ncbi:MAG: hypothetical protein IPJ75_12630 [Ignavibacteriales bacterium]|nr:hypothetical protein [Ignavibacteriales bacterium]
MLIEFKVKNFGPFRDENLFSMVASNYDKTTLEEDNVAKFEKFDLRLLKSAAVLEVMLRAKLNYLMLSHL